MPLAPNRELTPITSQAHAHMKRIVAAYKKRGIPESNTHWLSDLILSQPIPNGSAHWVGDDEKEYTISAEQVYNAYKHLPKLDATADTYGIPERPCVIIKSIDKQVCIVHPADPIYWAKQFNDLAK